MGIGIIIGMTTLTVGSAISEKILMGMGKADASQMVSVATISGVCITALTVFAQLISSLSKLGGA